MKAHSRSRILASLALLSALGLAGCGDTAKPVPVKNNQTPPPYADKGIDAVGVGRDPSHHSPFGSPSEAETSAAQPVKKP